MVTVQVRDKSPKRIIRQLVHDCKGERDYPGMWAVMDEWCHSGKADVFGSRETSFSAYCRRQSWTLAQAMALLEWQCKYFGEGIDEAEFNDMWSVFQPILKDQRLLDVRVALVALGLSKAPRPTDDHTRAGGLEV